MSTSQTRGVFIFKSDVDTRENIRRINDRLVHLGRDMAESMEEIGKELSWLSRMDAGG